MKSLKTFWTMITIIPAIDIIGGSAFALNRAITGFKSI